MTPFPLLNFFKDTVNILPGEYVDIAIKFDNPGAWMSHCHIVDHEDDGMLTMLSLN